MPGIILTSMVFRQPWGVIREFLWSKTGLELSAPDHCFPLPQLSSLFIITNPASFILAQGYLFYLGSQANKSPQHRLTIGLLTRSEHSPRSIANMPPIPCQPFPIPDNAQNTHTVLRERIPRPSWHNDRRRPRSYHGTVVQPAKKIRSLHKRQNRPLCSRHGWRVPEVQQSRLSSTKSMQC
jgi:hypothetical protein